jgi:hypothetical protein
MVDAEAAMSNNEKKVVFSQGAGATREARPPSIAYPFK